ncbi:hypothetical protein NQ317_005525 [Molorchus minor]|uniref:Uncharacterized protein n=1 Tax=Molorchus minor TaxID=1323400 RepID=A0ABQ9J1Q1_9CUCU|nr:hypothetical protein NQ317_005525 [Molorchus minor]
MFNAYNVSRGNYNYLQEGHVNYFQHLLGDDRVIMDLSDLEKYNVDWYLQSNPFHSLATQTACTCILLYIAESEWEGVLAGEGSTNPAHTYPHPYSIHMKYVNTFCLWTALSPLATFWMRLLNTLGLGLKSST